MGYTPQTAPTALKAAILQASHDFGIPPDLLYGIWLKESGGAYPNVAVNSSGYGGLFGTTDWKGAPVEQADLAASILETGLEHAGGNVSEALSYYNSGQLTGGYTSVPDETTFGTITGYHKKSGGGGGIGSDIASGAGAVAGVVTDPIGSLFGVGKSAAGDALGGATSGLEAFGYQALFVIIGLGLIMVGLALVAWTVMGKVGAPGIIGMTQQQMRINQAAARTRESSRASMVREGQASQRIAGQGEQRQLASRRLDVQERNQERRENPATVRTSYSVQERVVMKNRNTRGKGKP